MLTNRDKQLLMLALDCLQDLMNQEDPDLTIHYNEEPYTVTCDSYPGLAATMHDITVLWDKLVHSFQGYSEKTQEITKDN